MQDLMIRIFTMRRNGVDFEQTGQVVLSILTHLHNARRTHNFSATITQLYAPILWRYIRVSHLYPLNYISKKKKISKKLKHKKFNKGGP